MKIHRWALFCVPVKKQEQIELLELDASGIHVAEYLTALPPKAVLEQRLHQAMINARLRLDNKNE